MPIRPTSAKPDVQALKLNDYSTPTAADPELTMRLLAHSPDCIKLIDLDGRLLAMNEPGLGLMEIDDFSTLQGVAWEQCWPAAAREQIVGALATARDGGVARFSGFCPTSKGTPKWWDVVVSPVRDGGNQLSMLLAISRDVTAQTLAEQRLQSSEQRFRALADNMAQLSWMADGSGSIFWFNRRWFEFSGLSEQASLGQGWQSAHHPDHIDRVVKKINDHFARGDAWEDTFPLRGAGGDYRWFLSRAMPTRDEHGDVVLWCGTNTDITEQRSAGARLRQMARLIELSHEAILIWDLENGVQLWNEGCEKLYGFSRSEAVGKRSHELLSSRHGIGIAEFENVLKTQGAWTGEVLHIAKDGSKVWVDSRQELIRFGDRSVVLETNRDITDRRRADETRNILVAELDHRVKNTLAIVQSIAGQTARHSNSIDQFVASFNDRLQALSSAHNVLTDANWKGGELTELIDVQLAGQDRGRGNFDIHGPNVWLSAQTALQLSLILHELMSNAHKHGALSRVDGRVAITWRVSQGAPARLRLTWKESGGPKVEVPTRLGFGTTLINRTGSQQTVQAQLAFEPEGVVCHISAELPTPEGNSPAYFDPGRSDAKSRAALREPLEPVEGGRARHRYEKILIIEDEPLIAIEIEGILAGAGYVPLGPVDSVAAALIAIDGMQFDGVLLDRNLFGASADPIAAKLAEMKKPFAFVSGFDSGQVPLEQASIQFVSKPIRASELVAAVAAILTPRCETRSGPA